MQLNGKMELERDNEGPAYDIFARLLRGLAGTRLAKPGKFRTADGTGYALRCSYKVGPRCNRPHSRMLHTMCSGHMLFLSSWWLLLGVALLIQGSGSGAAASHHA